MLSSRFESAARRGWARGNRRPGPRRSRNGSPRIRPGYLEQRDAFGPEGVYGKWLRGHAAAALEQGTAFLHGGVSPAMPESLDEINRRVREELAQFDEDRKTFVAQGLILPFFDLQETFQALREELEAMDAAEAAGKKSRSAAERGSLYQRFLQWDKWTINSPEGPFWFREYSRWSDEEGRFQVTRLLSAVHAQRFVVGHTVQQNGRIQVRFAGTVYMIDTGMLDGTFFPGGRASALEISDGVVSAIYPGQPREVLKEAPAKKASPR